MPVASYIIAAFQMFCLALFYIFILYRLGLYEISSPFMVHFFF